MSDKDIAATVTRYGMQDGFDYNGFTFSEEFPIPVAHVVAYGMAHFRGPDGFLWFAPNKGFGSPDIDWTAPQNIAEFDLRQDDGVNAYHADPEYRETIADLCHALDALIAADARSDRWCTSPHVDPHTANAFGTCGQATPTTGQPAPMDDAGA
jgi:hypothetical protein